MRRPAGGKFSRITTAATTAPLLCYNAGSVSYLSEKSIMGNDDQMRCRECHAVIKMRSFRLFNGFHIQCQECGVQQTLLPFRRKSDPENEMLTRTQLHRMIIFAGGLRTLSSMTCWVVLVFLLSQVFPQMDPDNRILIWIVSCLIIPWPLTILFCHQLVTCPKCGVSLWNCRSGNFKPGRLRLKDDTEACPSCHAEFLD